MICFVIPEVVNKYFITSMCISNNFSVVELGALGRLFGCVDQP